MKKILWVSIHAPYKASPHAGGQTFNYYFNDFLHDKRFEVCLVSLGVLEEQKKIEMQLNSVQHNVFYPEKGIKSIGEKIVNIDFILNPFSKWARTTSNYRANNLLRIVREKSDSGYRPDVVILEWTACILMCQDLKKIFPKARYIASAHDITFVGYERKLNYYKGMRRLYWRLLYKSEKEKELVALKECNLIYPQNFDNRLILAKEGLDRKKISWLVPYFHSMIHCQHCETVNHDILFFGAMDREENWLSAEWFIKYVMPLITDLNVRFIVLGGNPPDKLKKYDDNKVLVMGYVEDIEPYFQSSMCFVAPLVLGAGIKVKVLEALSSGIPVITNNIGIEGISLESGNGYIHCEKPIEYAKAIREIYECKIDVKKMGKYAQEYITKVYSPEECSLRYRNEIYDLN